MFYLIPFEAHQLAHQSFYELLATFYVDYPIEEVRFNYTKNSDLREADSGHNVIDCEWRVVEVDSNYCVSNNFGNSDEEGVVDEQSVCVSEVGS